MTPLGITCAVIGSWLVLAAMGATVPHRLKRAVQHADPGEEYTPPPTPPLDPAWIDGVSVDALSDCDQLLHDRFHAIVDSEKWFTGGAA